MTSTTRPPAHLSWVAAGMLPDDIREDLLGAGAPFELVREPVLGVDLDVFARRPRQLLEVLRAAVDDEPEAIFLVDAHRTWTYRQTLDEVNAIAGYLVGRRGIEPGDRVAIVSANSAEYALVLWAVLAAGAIVTSLNGWWTTAELEHGIRLTSPSLLLGDERRLSRIDCSPAVADLPILRLDELVAAATEGNTSVLDVTGPTDEDDPAVILFTSGTTGRPKGATLSHRNLIHFCMASQLGAAIGEVLLPAPSPPARAAVILSSPLFHVSGLINLVMSGPALRTKLVFPPPGRWDETNHLELTTEHGITTWSGVPTQFLRLLRHPQIDFYDLSGLTRIGSGGAPFPPQLVREINLRLPNATIGNGFGMSETAGFGTISAGPLVTHAPDSVGLAQPGGEVEVRRADGTPATEDEVGEIHLRSPSVFLGYWDDPEATSASLDDDRWYRTGDFGRIAGGLLYLESRRRDLIIRAGENVYPIEIEHRLVEHPEIEDAAVIGVDHDLLGQEVVAIVVCRSDATLTAQEVQHWAAGSLASFKVPSRIEFRDALPYTDTGKVLKRTLEHDLAGTGPAQ